MNQTVSLSPPAGVGRALAALETAGWESWAVGGCVRDALLGRTPHDWDVTTAAPPEAVKAVFADKRVLETGLKHGTVTLLTEDGPVEITTFRTDGDYSDSRRPDSVAFVSDLHEDLRRRDFTVNAMAWSPLRGLRDDFGGREDLSAGIIRCVGDPAERFAEDALRILRALRFAARYGFTLEEATARALRNLRERLKKVSMERIFSELKGILTAPGAGEILRAFPEVFFTFLPEMEPMLGFDQRRPRAHHLDVWGHTALAVESAPPDELVRLTMFFHDCGKPATFSIDPETGLGRFLDHPKAGAALADELLRRLRCDSDTRRRVTELIANHQMLDGHSRRVVRRLLSRLGEEDMRRLIEVLRADARAHTPETCVKRLALADEDERMLNELLAENACLHVRDLAVNGADLMALGVSPGPVMGRILSGLLEEVMDDTLPNRREELLRRAAELWKDASGPEQP